MSAFAKHLAMCSIAGATFWFLAGVLPGPMEQGIFGAVFLAAWIFLYRGIFEKKAILSFGKLTWDPSELGHILVLGQTRRGKTSSGFSQIIHQLSRSEPRWGGLVLGVKNTEHQFYEAHFAGTPRKDDVKVLRVRSLDDPQNWEPPIRINLTGDSRFPWSAYATMIVDTVKSISGEGDNPFWADTAEQLFTYGFHLLEIVDSPATIPELYKALTDYTHLEGLLDKLKGRTDDMSVRINAEFQKRLLSAEAKEQLEGTEGTLRQYLSFFLQEDIQKVFCSLEPNVHLEDMDYGKVLCSSIPQHFPKERKFIHTMLKQLAYYHGMMRFDKEADKPGYIRQCNRLLLVMDEAQDVITSSETGMSDHTIADRIGGAKVTLVFAMQSAHSAESKIKKERNRNLINHFSTRLYFQLGDEEEAEEAAKYIGKTKKVKVRRTYDTGDIVSRNKNIDRSWEFDVPPVIFLRLDKHQVVICHPKRTFEIMELPPLDPKGQVEKWFKPTGIRKIRKLATQSQK